MKQVIVSCTLLMVLITTGFGATKKTEKNESLNVMTYNLRFNNPRDGENAWENRKDRVKDLIAYHEVDIFGTQEGLTGQLEDLCELTAYAYIGGGRDDGKDKGEHTAIFYKTERFKLLDHGDFWLSETPEKPSFGWGATLRRVSSWGKFKDKTTNKVFFVFNTHFDHVVAEARRQSAHLIVNKIKELAGKAPVFFMGDLNSTPETEQVKTLSDFMSDSRAFSLAEPYGPEGTFNGFNYMSSLRRRIDYIFVHNRITVLKYGVLTDSYEQKFPSDHLPVIIKAVIE